MNYAQIHARIRLLWCIGYGDWGQEGINIQGKKLDWPKIGKMSRLCGNVRVWYGSWSMIRLVRS